MQTYTFHVSGMHCNACILMTESELKDVQNVRDAVSSLKTHSVVVTGDFGEKEPEVIARELSAVLAKHGYALSVEKQRKAAQWSQFTLAAPLALGFLAVFVALQKMGLVNVITGDSVSYGTAFVIGIVASLSTCMAVVGGLVLSMSATFAKEGDSVRPQLLFHAGRLIAFFVLGGVIGAIGSAFALSGAATFLLSLAVGLVMLIMGVNLLDVFHGAKRLQIPMPRFVVAHARAAASMNHTLTPFAVGVATFFLPCGFTQAMQLYTLSVGSYWGGALTMSAFALGTLPVLLALSFSSLSIHGSAHRGVFFKTAGLIVILFAVFNLLTSLIAIGLIPPIFNF